MPWKLEIHIIDVGQGESSLIIAKNGPQHRTMLIDGGLAGYAETVHTYVKQQLDYHEIDHLDHIVVSHYDDDHSGGVIALLTADNLYGICKVIADAAGRAAWDAANNGTAVNQDQDHQVAAAAAAARAAAEGGYNDGTNDYSGLAAAAGQAEWRSVFSPATPIRAVARDGSLTGYRHMGRAARNPPLIKTTQKANEAAIEAGLVAGTTAGSAAVRSRTALNSVLCVLHSVSEPCTSSTNFLTGGIYHNTNIIDTGDTPGIDDDYKPALHGGVLLSTHRITPPLINRRRTSDPALGSEVFWGTGARVGNPPANAPGIFVVACNKHIWPRGGPISGGLQNNDDSIGLVLRFNSFFYYTGGDLPSRGEDLVADAITRRGLPNPAVAGGSFPVAERIACFKCGHHGSKHSTSAAFLRRMKPRAAFISCGEHDEFEHPHQEVIDRLVGETNVKHFYLTNCRYTRNHIPASNTPPDNQLTVPGNKSRLAGDNEEVNLEEGRRRGNVKLSVSQAESNRPSGDPQRRFHIEYYDPDTHVENINPEWLVY